jgi:hypothetical protein
VLRHRCPLPHRIPVSLPPIPDSTPRSTSQSVGTP